MSESSRLADRPIESGERLIASWEIVSVTVSALIAEWAISTFADNARLIAAIPIALAVGLMLFSHRQRRETLRILGFRFDNFVPALRLLILPTLGAIVVIVLANWLFAGGLSLRPIRIRLFFVPAWALFQQYALQGYINRRAQMVFGQRLPATLLVAVVFATLHLPSPLLALLAFVGALVWAHVYQKQPNLFAVALSHTLASWTLSFTIPPSLTPYLRIGVKYFGLSI